MLGSAHANGTRATAEVVVNSLSNGIQWGLDRMLSVGYGVVYDYIFEHFRPYQDLQAEVRRLVETTAVEGVDRKDVRVLDLGCGPGNFTLSLAEAGFSVIEIGRAHV